MTPHTATPALGDGERFAPTARALLIIALVAVALRGVSVVAMGVKFDRWADLPYQSDGSAYLGNAARINGEGMPNEYDQRMFVGLPWAIAMAQRVTHEYGWTAQGLCLVFAGLMCAAWAWYFRDTRIGWALAILPPHWVNDTSAVMNESLMLLLCGVGIAASTMKRAGSGAAWTAITAGVAFGAAGMVRPMACFAAAGAAAFLLVERRTQRALAVLGLSMIAFATMYGLFTWLYWNPMENVRVYRDHPVAYGGEMITWPFKSMLAEFHARGVLNPRVLYKCAYIFGGLAIGAYAIRCFVRSRHPLDALAMTWWCTNMLFVLCIGSTWGMRIAQRSTAWALPAAMYLLRPWLPVKWYWRLAWSLLPVPFLFFASQG